MADTKITALTALAGESLAANDLLVAVDVSDTTMAASGTDKKVLAGSLAFNAPYKTGWYYGGSLNSNDLSAIFTEGQIKCSPFVVWRRQAFDRMGFEITTSGSTGALVRLGIWERDGTLVLDAGTYDGTEAAGWKTKTISLTLDPGVYLCAAVPQGGATTRTEVRVGDTPNGLGMWLMGREDLEHTPDLRHITATAQTGAFGDLASMAASAASPPATIVLRAA